MLHCHIADCMRENMAAIKAWNQTTQVKYNNNTKDKKWLYNDVEVIHYVVRLLFWHFLTDYEGTGKNSEREGYDMPQQRSLRSYGMCLKATRSPQLTIIVKCNK